MKQCTSVPVAVILFVMALDVKTVLRELKKLYPKADCTLDFKNPLELLVATILSAQCTDKRVNIVTKKLFKKYRNHRITF